MAKGEMSVQEAGRRGGEARKAAGADYGAMGRKGGAVTRERLGQAHFRRIGLVGGRAVREKYGERFFSAIGQKGGQRTRELVARGRERER